MGKWKWYILGSCALAFLVGYLLYRKAVRSEEELIRKLLPRLKGYLEQEQLERRARVRDAIRLGLRPAAGW